ncbi:MAG: hypothetical protein SGILL_005314 [Bacillariaceae sp.]
MMIRLKFLHVCTWCWVMDACCLAWVSRSTSTILPSSQTQRLCPLPETTNQRIPRPYGLPSTTTRLYGLADSSNEAEEPSSSSSSSKQQQPDNWLEKWAIEGAAKIAKLDLNERTQRVMLAEMAEDKIYELTVALEKLVDEETGEISDMEAAKEIAEQSRSLQGQYKALVTGEESSVLNAMASLKERDY